MGLRWASGGHENPRKTHEFSGVYFNLKGRSWTGPTKLSIALSAEGSHRGAMPVTARRMTSPLITSDKLNSWFDFFNSILLIPGWVKLAEPFKVWLDIIKVWFYINLGVPDEPMFRQPLLGPGC